MAKFAVADVDAVLLQTTLRVQVGDVNYGGHLANDAVLRLCHEVRMRWLAGLGWSETDAGGAGLIMADAAVQYLAQGFYGDELSAEMGVEDIGKGGFALPRTARCWRGRARAWCVSIMRAKRFAGCLRL